MRKRGVGDLSILSMAANRKRGNRLLCGPVVLVILALMLMAACLPGPVLAASVFDVVKETARANSHVEEGVDMSSAESPIAGGSMKWSQVHGDLNTGEEWAGAWFEVVEPGGNTSMDRVIDHLVAQLDEDANMKVVAASGYEMREITYDDYALGVPNDDVEVWIILARHIIQVDIHETGYDKAANLQMGRDLALQLKGGLEKAGLTQPPAASTNAAGTAPASPAQPTAAVTGNPLAEPVTVADTMNIAGVGNGPTAPTTFSLSSPHLITLITNYHWNNARGAAPGTIGFKDSNGKVYGPWPVTTRLGQGGVPNAYWDVTPNIVVPAGTYTIIDSDPSTWSQNAQSGGRGMGEVRATPHFEVTGGRVGDIDSTPDKARGSYPVGHGDSPAGVGSVGSIPGPSNTTEAVTGVVVPGLIATALGALGSLGGGGGLVPPITGTPAYPGGGGGSGPLPGGAPGTSRGPGGMGQATNQIGRRGKDDIFIDTTDVFEEPGGGRTAGEAAIIDTADEAGVFVGSASDILVDTIQEEPGVIPPKPGSWADGSGSEILIDTSALEGEASTGLDTIGAEGEPGKGTAPEAGETTGLSEESPYDREGYDAQGFDKDGFDKAGYDAQGFDKEGFDAKGFDKEGFDKEGFDAKGFDKEGFDKDGFDAKGFDKEGFDKDGFDAQGFNKEGFDKEGYDRNGFDSQGFDREGYDVNGYNAKGFNRSGYDAQGYDPAGFDKQGFNQAGLDREGFNREGFDQAGYDRAGYDKAGYDREGYDREGYDRQGLEREGYDADGYDQNGFNKNGVDKDGFDREGFDYEGYNRAGYDPWGYNKQGYGKDGYHWSGYNADGYNRSGRHWSENPYKDSPFDVTVAGNTNPFAQDRDVIASVEVELDADGNVIGGRNLADTWKPTKPPLGEPYPKTAEKYGAKPWDDEIPAPQPEKPTVPGPEDTGVIGPEDPMNTLKHHGLDKDAATGGEGPADAISIPEEDIPQRGWPGSEPEEGFPGDQIPATQPGNTFDYTDPETGVTSSFEYESGYTGPRHGERQILVGSGDGQSYEVEFNAVTGKWVNTETGNDFDPSRFESWQRDVAEDQRRAAIDLEKMAARQDATSKAIDKNLEDWRQLEQMQKAADKYAIGTPGGPGDVDKVIQGLKDDMLAGKEADEDRMEQLRKIIGNRIEGRTVGDSGLRREEDWIDTMGYALEANLATAKEVVTGEKADGSISWKGMAAKLIITTATGGVPGKILDVGLTAADALSQMKDEFDKGGSDFRIVSRAMGTYILGEQMGWLAGNSLGALNKSMLKRFPAFTNKAADFIETALLKGSAKNQLWSRKLGLISKEAAESALDQINKRLVDIGSDEAARGIAKTARAKYGLESVADSFDDVAKGAGKTTQAAGKTTQAAGKSADAIKPSRGPVVTTETPGLKIDKNSFKEAGLPPDLRGMPTRDQKAIRSVCDKYGVKAHMRPTNPDSRAWLEAGRAHPKPEMLKAKTINQLDVELGYPKENIGTVGCRRPDPLPAAKPAAMTDAHWSKLQKRHGQRMTEYTDQAAKLQYLEKKGLIVWDQKTGIIYNKQTMKPYCGDHDTFAIVDAVSGKPVSPRMNEQINRELQSLGATQHPEHVGWDYSGLSDQVPDGAAPGAQAPREIAEAIDRKILGGHGEGGEALNTYDPLRGEEGGWTTNWWQGGVRE